MRFRPLLALSILALALVSHAPLAADASYTADLARDLGEVEGKIVALAEAIPADKYSWSPAPGVRSVSQALMHVASGNYFFPTLFGATIPDGVDVGSFDSITDPEEVVATLKGSFASLRGAIEAIPSDRLHETLDIFGQETTIAGGLHAAVSHSHEHLGQMIAYARSIGVTPPWSQ
jgi:uncharacterized damage-inducible protein DinB